MSPLTDRHKVAFHSEIWQSRLDLAERVHEADEKPYISYVLWEVVLEPTEAAELPGQ